MTKVRIGSRVSIENIDIDEISRDYLFGEILQISKWNEKVMFFLIEYTNKFQDTEKRWFPLSSIKAIT